MRNLSLLVILVFSFSACSLPDFKTHPNAWQHKSVNAFSSYTKNFLRSNDEIAKNDLSRAISHAKNSADLTGLARIYLGECALHVSVGNNSTCKQYDEISELVDSNKLDSYKDFLTKNLAKSQIPLLPKNYQDFALHVESSNYTQANKDILDMKRTTSKLLSAALIKDDINIQTINHIIDTASFHGYKKAVIFWLYELKNKIEDNDKKEKITKKIAILNSK